MISSVRDTSLMAYMDLREDLGERQMMVYSALKLLGEATDMEIARSLGRSDPNFVRPRRNELVKLGFVVPVGKRLCSVTKKLVYAWSVR